MKLSIIAFFVLSLCAGVAEAQHPALVTEPDATPYRPGPNRNEQAAEAKAAADTVRLLLPIRVGFQEQGYAFDNLLFIEQQSAQRNHTSAVNPPDHGTIMLDGATASRRPYDELGGSGRTDLVLSHFIDLSGFTPADSLYLTFWYERSGRNDAPEATDSLFLYLREATDSNAAFTFFPTTPVWFTVGGGTQNNGHWVHIPLNDSAYFTSDFQLRWENSGSLSGMFDCWHLDYVVLGANRTAADTSFADFSLVEYTGFMGDTVRSLPFATYQTLNPNQLGSMGLVVRNLDLQNATSRQLTLTLRVAYTENILGTQFLTANLAPGQIDTLDWTQFLFPILTEATMLEIRAYTNSSDDYGANDTLSFFFTVANGMGYSDGEPETGYGITAARGFGQRYGLGQPAKIQAVWMAFFPTRPFATQFRLAIWDPTMPPDSLLYDSYRFPGVAVNGSSTLGTNDAFWIRFELDSAINVPALVQVGAIQTSSTNLAVGLDRNRNQGFRIFYDNNGNWIPNSISGTLCQSIEIEGDILIGTAPTTTGSLGVLRVYPNPLNTNRLLLLDVSGFGANAQAEILLMDATGRVVFQHTESVAGLETLQLPLHIPAGVYHFWATVREPGKPPLGFTQKLIVE